MLEQQLSRLAVTLTVVLILGWLMNIYFDEGGPGGEGPAAP